LDPFRFVLIAWPGWMNDRQWLSKILFRNEFSRATIANDPMSG